MSEYDNQLKRMRAAFAASIVKSMTPEEINNTFQKLHDENEALKQRAEKAERERDEYETALLDEHLCDIVTQDKSWYGCIHCHREFITNSHENDCIITKINNRRAQLEGERCETNR